MRGRIVAAIRRERPALAGRVDITTFHAWGLNVLRTYGPRLGLPLDMRLLDTGDLYLLLSRNLAALQLDHFKDIRTPTCHLLAIINAISRIKDELRTPEGYALLAEAEAERLVQQAEAEHGGATKKEQQARRRADELQARLQKRMEQLDLEAQIAALPHCAAPTRQQFIAGRSVRGRVHRRERRTVPRGAVRLAAERDQHPPTGSGLT